MFQLDGSKSLYRKWLEITKHPFINSCLGFQVVTNIHGHPKRTHLPMISHACAGAALGASIMVDDVTRGTLLVN